MGDQRQASRLVFLLTMAVVIWLLGQLWFILQYFSDVLFLFFLAWLVAFILFPVADWLEKLRIARPLAVMLIYLVLLAALVVAGLTVGPALVYQLEQLGQTLPDIVQQLPTVEQVEGLLERLGISFSDMSLVYRPDQVGQQLQNLGGLLVQGTLSIAAVAVSLLLRLVILLFISYYLVLDGRKIVRLILRSIPPGRRRDFVYFVNQLSSNFSGFLTGQLIQGALFAVVVAVVMLVLRVDFVVVATIASGILMLVPVIGPLLSLLPPLTAAAVLQPAAWLPMLVVLFVVEMVLINIFMPRILGGRLGMHPVLVVAAILVGVRVGGVLGAFFGIPIAGVAYGMAALLYKTWWASASARRQTDEALPDLD